MGDVTVEGACLSPPVLLFTEALCKPRTRLRARRACRAGAVGAPQRATPGSAHAARPRAKED
jgi:hypothetical protein